MYASSCAAYPIRDGNMGLPWATIAGGIIDVARNTVLKRKYPQPLPPALPFTVADVKRLLERLPNVRERMVALLSDEGHTRIRLGREPTAADYANINTLADLALWFANGTGDDLSRGEDEIRQLILIGMQQLDDMPTTAVPYTGTVPVSYPGSTNAPPVPDYGPGFPANTTDPPVTGPSIWEQVQDVAKDAAEAAARAAAAAAAQSTYGNLPPNARDRVDQYAAGAYSRGMGETLSANLPLLLAGGLAVGLLLKR